MTSRQHATARLIELCASLTAQCGVVAFLASTVLTLTGLAVARAEPPSPLPGTVTDVPAFALSFEDREALGRVAYAEAGSQREEGLAAVAHAVLNRVAAGRFGAGVQGVLDAPGQFEPVTRAGGSWRDLPPLTEPQRLVFGTILDLILQGRLPDLTGGSTYFQNAATVAQRAAAGLVSPRLVNFGGQVPTAVVRDHSFFRAAGPPGNPAVQSSLSVNRGAGRAGIRAVQQAPAFYRVVDGQLQQVRPTLVDPASAAMPQAKFIRVGTARDRAAGLRILRGADSPGPGTPPAF